MALVEIFMKHAKIEFSSQNQIAIFFSYLVFPDGGGGV